MKLGDYLANSALRYPDRYAFICGEDTRTFSQLDARATRIANALTEHGLVHGDRIALHSPNCLEAVDVMCAAARAGAVVVPISSRLSDAEVDYVLSDCTPRFLFVDSSLLRSDAAANSASGPTTFVLGDSDSERGLENLIASGSDTPAESLPHDVEDLVLGYTSGTTGNPKGAVGTHAAMIICSGYVTGIEYGLGRDDVLLITSPIAHRVGLSRVINTLCLGLSTVIMHAFDPVAAVDLIERHRVTCISVVPTIARLLAPEFERRPKACATLARLFATGEAFPVPLKARLHAALPRLGLHTSYAQTEAGIVSNLRPEEQLERPESIGRPVPGVEVRIVDDQFNELPVGEAGEVLVRCGHPGQAMVMRKYFNRPEDTRDAFRDGWLRTGDICRINSDGYLYFVDRLKDMIVSGGLNIYAKEVELAIGSHPDVADAAVVGVPDVEFGEAVLAFVELELGSALGEAAVIDHCRSLIASYKKPRFVCFVREMPRTASGKVRKQVLVREVLGDLTDPDAAWRQGSSR